MGDFVLIFRSNSSDVREHIGTPERAQKSMQAWQSWLGRLENGRHVKERGHPMELSGQVLRGKGRTVTDGPYLETKDMVMGFIIIAARDLTQARELASGCPMLDGEGSVEIRPVRELSGESVS